MYGSIQHREAEIEALSEALDQVHALRDDVENKNESITCLRAMIKFLRDMETSEGKDLRVECAKVPLVPACVWYSSFLLTDCSQLYL